jgi:MOSC domain-containing protein YiiM
VADQRRPCGSEVRLLQDYFQPSTQTGRIFQINASNGGVPKLPLRQAEVTRLGLVGDRQANLQVHGGPERAVCLYSLERILALQAEGHPIYPGSIGENLTVSGLDWEAMAPGVQVRFGEEVLLEVTSYTTPCSHIASSFIDDDSTRVSQKRYPGWSRVYARVLQPGRIRIGDQAQMVNVLM